MIGVVGGKQTGPGSMSSWFLSGLRALPRQYALYNTAKRDPLLAVVDLL